MTFNAWYFVFGLEQVAVTAGALVAGLTQPKGKCNLLLVSLMTTLIILMLGLASCNFWNTFEYQEDAPYP